MTNNYYGDNINQIGGIGNVGKIVNQAAADPSSALEEIIRLAEELRGEVSPADCRTLDQSVEVLRGGEAVERRSLRSALASIAGIAAVVGEVGVPVIEAVRKTITALGLS
jgi:hypothetical protein